MGCHNYIAAIPEHKRGQHLGNKNAERPVNELPNGFLRQYIPKGVSIERYIPEYLLHFADELNSRLRKRLGYQMPEELFDAFLDKLYIA